MRFHRFVVLTAVLVIAVSALAQEQAPPASFDQVIERVMEREAQFNKSLRSYNPIVETYIQNMRPDKELGSVPASDRYFLGRMTFQGRVSQKSFVDENNPGFFSKTYKRMTGFMRVDYLPLGFAQMVLVDGRGLDRAHYDFNFVRREFLGELRTIVIDVTPKAKAGPGRFLGRIWVEDQNYNVVRFNGTYEQGKKGVYLHFDSWRLNMAPGLWLPAYVYSEESGVQVNMFRSLHFKAQTRLWGYNVSNAAHQSEFTQVLVDTNEKVKDQSQNVQDMSPIASQREWESQAEENVVERLQRASLLAPPGDVDKVLQTVVNNLEITNNIDVQPEIHCRVLLTTPLETFTIGHTIVISRGLLDTLPDEATLAAVLAHELAHVVLGHRLDTRYAFSDRMLFSDELTFQKFDLQHPAADEDAADKKAFELLQNSPYKDKLQSVGLFLRQVEASRAALPNLIRARMGNPMFEDKSVRLDQLVGGAPELAPRDVKQIAALPLGGRIKVDPFDNTVEISK
ncbi:MAG TPA: M48 family metalloprotease, partial [Terriglobales bacterium]|nr:M48 family metalloprotease [Terriglobales bacterium]